MAQVESLRCVTGEAERYARDCALLAMEALKEQAKAKGGNLENSDVMDIMKDIFGESVESNRLKCLVSQARKRQETRKRHKDPFSMLSSILARLKAGIQPNGLLMLLQLGLIPYRLLSVSLQVLLLRYKKVVSLENLCLLK